MKKEQSKDEFIRKRIERQKRIRKRRTIIFFCFIIVLLICVGITLSLTVFFPIENIKITGSKVYSAELIEKNCGVAIGDNLFVASENRSEKLLRAALPYIETVEFNRQLPGELTIKVKDADEYAVYLKDNRYFTVSKSGWILSEGANKQENLLLICGAEIDCTLGTQIKYNAETERELIETVMVIASKKEIPLNQVDISDKLSLKLFVDKRFEVDLGNSNNLEEKINHLKGMIDKIPKEKSGKINLSMWTSNNTTGTFVEKPPNK